MGGGNKLRLEFEDGTTKTASVKIKKPTDIIEFVAGTTDPINTAGLKHQSNKEYWRGKKDNFWKQVKEFKNQFNDLHIEDSFFSWSGDNNTEERAKAAERLRDLLLRVYKNWKKREIHLHLIGHSHGGNVINEFTNIIAEKDKFPESWKIKSITYLSTPFFKKQHQLNHTKLHKECKIINVYNEYDITQRFVADFTLKNLDGIILHFDQEGCKKALDKINKTKFEKYEELGPFAVVNNHTEGPTIWKETINLLGGVENLFKSLEKSMSFIGNPQLVSKEKAEFLSILNDIKVWAKKQKGVFEKNKKNRNGGYGRSEFFEDINLLKVLKLLNRIFKITDSEKNSYLLNLFDKVLNEENSGFIDKIDDTSWTPKNQLNNTIELVDIDITDKDLYYSRGKKVNFDKFASGIEKVLKRNDENSLKEVLVRLISQFITAEDVQAVIDKLWWFEFIVWGKTDTQLKLLSKHLKVYKKLIKKYNANLVATKDASNDDIINQPGSVPYLAKTSHSLSYTKLFDDANHNVKKALSDSFSSGRR